VKKDFFGPRRKGSNALNVQEWRRQHQLEAFASLSAFKNGAVERPMYRVRNDLQQPRGNHMGSVRNWFKKLSSSDHRRAERLEAPLLVGYYWDGSIPTGHEVRNISLTGFYLVTTEHWHPGTVITVTLQRTDIPDATASSEGYITVLSKVIRLDVEGAGFVFVLLPDKGCGGANDHMRGAIDKKAIVKFMGHLKSAKNHAVRMQLWKRLEERYEEA
jgi:hypothetical protein